MAVVWFYLFSQPARRVQNVIASAENYDTTTTKKEFKQTRKNWVHKVPTDALQTIFLCRFLQSALFFLPRKLIRRRFLSLRNCYLFDFKIPSYWISIFMN